MMDSNRRDFIKYVVAGALAVGCPGGLSQTARATIEPGQPKLDSEDNTICHKVRDGARFKRPSVSSTYELIIIGGGISGLVAAYRSGNCDFLLLEKEPHLGGNAYAMEYENCAFATGTAYIESGIAVQLARELGMEPLPINNWDGSIIKGDFIPDCWGSGLDHLPYRGPVRDSFRNFRDRILKITVERRAKELDNLPFTHFLRGYPPEIKEWWDCFGPSNWGALAHETSSLVAITAFQAFAGPNRNDDRFTWPGGIGALSRRLVDTLLPKSDERMLKGCTAVAVENEKDAVNVTYMHQGELTTVAAKAVIMATPKYITARLVVGLPPAQLEAMRKIRYVPYPVVNLLYDKPVFDKGYDTWCPGNSFTDVIVADWTIRNRPDYSPKFHILSCYAPMRESDRSLFLSDAGTIEVAKQVVRDVTKTLPDTQAEPIEVHIFRRGHPMFMAIPGNSTHTLPQVRKPFDRIFFANTDSQGPISTTTGAIQAAERAIDELAARLKKA
jgi:monoamine oxidase